jgi:hypothetical protein
MAPAKRSIAPDAVNNPPPLRLAVFASSPDELAVLKEEFGARGIDVTAVLVPSESVATADVKHDGGDYTVITDSDTLRTFFEAHAQNLDAVYAPINLAPLSGFVVAREAKLRRIHPILQAQPAVVMPAMTGVPSQAAGTLSASELAAAKQGGYTLLAYDSPNILDAVIGAIPKRARQ